jgi:hypothetical protein
VLWPARSARTALAVGLASALAVSCGAHPEVAVPSSARAPQAEGEFPDDPRALLRFHSLRFKLSVPLPDGRAWKIDDHHDRALLARHAPTRSTLTVLTFTDPELMNRQRCLDRATEMGLLALHDPITIEDETTIGPDAFDTRIWIALEARASPAAAMTGHALLIGGYIRKCLFVHYATEVASEKEEPLLTSRLAVARLRILAGIKLEPFDEAPRAAIPGP